jgi:uncharacterized protein (TIGR02271 family)
MVRSIRAAVDFKSRAASNPAPNSVRHNSPRAFAAEILGVGYEHVEVSVFQRGADPLNVGAAVRKVGRRVRVHITTELLGNRVQRLRGSTDAPPKPIVRVSTCFVRYALVFWFVIRQSPRAYCAAFELCDSLVRSRCVDGLRIRLWTSPKEVEIGKRRIEDVEHISDTVRHEELHVDDATTVTADDAEPAFVTAAEYDGAPAFATATADDAARALATGLDDAAEAFITTADDAALVATANDAAPAPVATTDQDQEIELRAERLVVNKQRGQNGKARVRKEIVTEKKSIDVPVSHEEIVIDRHAVTGDVDVDSAPIADETIRIPLTEEQVDISKETVVREEVEIGTRRIEDVEHISDTVRHEEFRVDDAPTNHYYAPAF